MCGNDTQTSVMGWQLSGNLASAMTEGKLRGQLCCLSSKNTSISVPRPFQNCYSGVSAKQEDNSTQKNTKLRAFLSAPTAVRILLHFPAWHWSLEFPLSGCQTFLCVCGRHAAHRPGDSHINLLLQWDHWVQQKPQILLASYVWRLSKSWMGKWIVVPIHSAITL